MNRYKGIITAAFAIIAILIFAFWCSGYVSGDYGLQEQNQAEIDVAADTVTVAEDSTDVQAEIEPSSEETSSEADSDGETEKNPSEENIPDVTDAESVTDIESDNGESGKDRYLTDPVPEGKPVPVEPQDAVVSDKKLTCMLSVRCDTIIDNISRLDREKVELVPEDGVIFAQKVVEFCEGESVFDLLLREMKQNGIHMEFENTPIYNSAYIEGIANLYEFDCGELSGWMYKVNDWFPNYGCSRYQLKDGDRVEWVYTCDLGVDVGGHYSTKGE